MKPDFCYWQWYDILWDTVVMCYTMAYREIKNSSFPVIRKLSCHKSFQHQAFSKIDIVQTFSNVGLNSPTLVWKMHAILIDTITCVDFNTYAPCESKN